MVPLISTIAGDNSRSSLVSTIAGILSTVTTSSSATNPSSSAGATPMAVTQTVKKPSKPVKKNHACEMCGKAFRDVYHLNRHKLSHSDEKPFECPICNQRFKRKDRMTYHVRSHEGGITKPYTCGVCGKGFSRYHVENPRRAQVLAFHNQEGLSYHSEGLGEPDILEDWWGDKEPCLSLGCGSRSEPDWQWPKVVALLWERCEMISRPHPGPVGHVSVSLVVTTEPLYQPLQRSVTEWGMAGKLSPCLVARLRRTDRALWGSLHCCWLYLLYLCLQQRKLQPLELLICHLYTRYDQTYHFQVWKNTVKF